MKLAVFEIGKHRTDKLAGSEYGAASYSRQITRVERFEFVCRHLLYRDCACADRKLEAATRRDGEVSSTDSSTCLVDQSEQR